MNAFIVWAFFLTSLTWWLETTKDTVFTAVLVCGWFVLMAGTLITGLRVLMY
jgi:hypothetical protein